VPTVVPPLPAGVGSRLAPKTTQEVALAPNDRSDGVHAKISNAVVGIFREYTGRGPTKARTTIGQDLVVVILEDALTKGERVLADNGQEESVVLMRRGYQATMRAELVAAVEKLMQRRVRAFLSDQITSPDITAETFVLEPAPE